TIRSQWSGVRGQERAVQRQLTTDHDDGRDHIENELPQPQVLLALGLLMLKPRRLRSSWKSTVASLRYIRLRLSTTTGTPWNSNVSSSFGLTSASRSSLCWKPLQPPPTTRSR